MFTSRNKYKRLFVKAFGSAVAGSGFWAWVTYFFAGTGCAFLLCAGLLASGVAIAAFSDEIADGNIFRKLRRLIK